MVCIGYNGGPAVFLKEVRYDSICSPNSTVHRDEILTGFSHFNFIKENAIALL